MEGDSKYGHDKSSKNPNVQDDIFDVYTQSDAPVDYMKSHYIHHMTKLAKQYYNTQAIMEMDEYKNRGELEALYTVVTYEGKEELIEIGRGIFTKEMFVRSDPVVPEYAGLLHSPLKLFVTSAWAREDDPYSDPKDFLSHHTIIRSLIGGQAEEYDTNTNRNIGYTSTSLQDAILILQNAEIHRAFPFKKSSESQKSFEKFSEKMKEIKKFTIEELKGRIDIKDGYNRYIDSDSKIFRQKIVDCLRHLSDENIKNMKKLVTSFDPSSGSFTRSIYNKAS